MLIVIARIKTRSGRIDKIVPLLQENTELGTSKQGHISSFLAKSTESENELLVYSLWENESLYEQAKKEIKKDPRTKKAMLQLLIHLSGEPAIETFTVIS
ncbi:antibiotic biosynthesis monooxygenase family protein [Phosphitispora fastidiosa]|uniref:antibiotic biosynthesis monooxygenase family protein n=1 Tax=Phosphitispora fastidiosa TaxID=2837202 RepID=UPI001E399655|nr:quinol monooxygenase YgiN [Phosphitispora fastidiosa]